MFGCGLLRYPVVEHILLLMQVIDIRVVNYFVRIEFSDKKVRSKNKRSIEKECLVREVLPATG